MQGPAASRSCSGSSAKQPVCISSRPDNVPSFTLAPSRGWVDNGDYRVAIRTSILPSHNDIVVEANGQHGTLQSPRLSRLRLSDHLEEYLQSMGLGPQQLGGARRYAKIEWQGIDTHAIGSRQTLYLCLLLLFWV